MRSKLCSMRCHAAAGICVPTWPRETQTFSRWILFRRLLLLHGFEAPQVKKSLDSSPGHHEQLVVIFKDWLGRDSRKLPTRPNGPTGKSLSYSSPTLCDGHLDRHNSVISYTPACTKNNQVGRETIFFFLQKKLFFKADKYSSF